MLHVIDHELFKRFKFEATLILQDFGISQTNCHLQNTQMDILRTYFQFVLGEQNYNG